jgi:hypothetical protein
MASLPGRRVAKPGQSRIPRKLIKSLEADLEEIARKANPRLLNSQKARRRPKDKVLPKLGLRQGRPTKDEMFFVKMLKPRK